MYALAAVAITTSAALGQDTTTPATVAQLEQLRSDLRSDMKAEIRAAIGEILGLPNQANDNLEIVKPIPTVADRLANLEERVQALSDVQEGNRQVIEQIAQRDRDGISFLRIDTSHEPTRSELRRAITETAPTRGIVIIRNKTNSNQAVAVNDTTYDVLANSERQVDVPYGPFQVRTSNDRTLNWDFSYPNTTAVVNIVIKTRPITTVSAPMYVTYMW
jgi:hypothetical protein